MAGPPRGDASSPLGLQARRGASALPASQPASTVKSACSPSWGHGVLSFLPALLPPPAAPRRPDRPRTAAHVPALSWKWQKRAKGEFSISPRTAAACVPWMGSRTASASAACCYHLSMNLVLVRRSESCWHMRQARLDAPPVLLASSLLTNRRSLDPVLTCPYNSATKGPGARWRSPSSTATSRGRRTRRMGVPAAKTALHPPPHLLRLTATPITTRSP